MTLAFPNDGHRHCIVGMTGSGKTVFGLFCLSRRSFDTKPWIIVDFKRDDTISRIEGLEEIGVNDAIPKRPGLFVVRPLPSEGEKDGPMTGFLWRVHARENTGLFIDEGYGFHARDPALLAVLTQGRSKRIPVIALSQRPAWISPFILSESEFKSIFYLQTPADIERVQDWLPQRDARGRKLDPSTLPPHHSYWYNGPARDFRYMGPCPDQDAVIGTFNARAPRRRQWI